MEYPILKVKEKARQMTDAFLGYNHNLRISDGEFFEMENMTSDYYPVLATRGNRGIHKDNVDAKAIIGKDLIAPTYPVQELLTDDLFYIDGSAIVINGERHDVGLNDKPKQLTIMGNHIIIMPDKRYVDTYNEWMDEDEGTGLYFSGNCPNIEHEASTTYPVTFSLCTLTGEEYGNLNPGVKPAETDGATWFDTSSTPPVLKKYSADQKMWVSIPTTYVKISSLGIGRGLKQYDGVEIDDIWLQGWNKLNGHHILFGCNENEIIIRGIPYDFGDDVAYEQESPMTISKKMPEMDFVVEAGNRLWGCRYGLSTRGGLVGDFVNEIYASKLGDFTNWECYMGISTDSYTVSVGSDGPFTGVASYMGQPIFFKENCIHRVSGDQPSNFRVQTTACRGVQKGSHKSLAIVNEVLYYKSANAVCAFDGSLPVEVSKALGDVRYSDAVACAHGNKYYIDMKMERGTHHLFVYDTVKGLWHKEDNIRLDDLCSYGGEVYGIEHGKNRIITLLGSGTKDETPVPWMVETGLLGLDLPDMKYISKVVIRLALDVGTTMNISIQYDSAEDWEDVCHMKATSLRSFPLTILPRRCDHFRLRIDGVGHGKIYSITKTIEQGSDVS